MVVSGVVKETDTQVVIYGNSAVNVVGTMKPFSEVDLAEDGRLNEALATDLATPPTSILWMALSAELRSFELGAEVSSARRILSHQLMYLSMELTSRLLSMRPW